MEAANSGIFFIQFCTLFLHGRGSQTRVSQHSSPGLCNFKKWEQWGNQYINLQNFITLGTEGAFPDQDLAHVWGAPWGAL